MSDDFHRPTLTFPAGAYNATQVRLYGIAAINISRQELIQFLEKNGNFTAANYRGWLDDQKKQTKDGDSSNRDLFLIPLDMKKFGIALLLTSAPETSEERLSVGVIVGYAFEGHCYDLPKPKVMLIPKKPSEIPIDDCGYDRKNNLPGEDNRYRVWIVDKLDECVELDMSQGFVEQLVLEANLPGKRSPTLYAGKMLLGHRNGRLTE